ncbi:hypothetical protein [Devosia sp. XK-2]|uniref:hypothetical protein n=1 Tax=Devosia sp. XK-2 TaxID=3126689 RepID=UPI0030D3FFB3
MNSSDLKSAGRCSVILEQALAEMKGSGAPPHIIIDRLISYGAFLAVASTSKAHAADQLRQIADAVEAGVFDGIGASRVGRG